MKILITSDLFSVKTNGVVTSLRNLRDAMVEKGHDVKILTLSEDMHSHKDENEEVYYICSVPIGIYPDLRMPLKYRHSLMKEIIEWKPDVIHSQCEFFSYQFALYISKKTRAHIIHTYHTMYEDYAQYITKNRKLSKYVLSKFFKIRLKSADRVIAPTKKVEELLVGYELDSPISIVPSGISLAQHKERISREERSKFRRELGIQDDRIVLLSLGRLGNEKNIDELLDFYAKARIQYENLMLLIVGDGPARDELESRTRELGLLGKVIFTGKVAPTEVQKYYQLGDVFVSASTSETQGLTYIEAAANGLPLLCRQDICLDDVIEQGENGYAYESEEEFLAYIDDIVHNSEWRENAARRSEEISEMFDKEVFGDSVEEIYKSVIE